MKKALVLIVLAAIIIGGAYWLSAMKMPVSSSPVAETTEDKTPVTTADLTVNGPFAIVKDAQGSHLADKNGNTLYLNTRDQTKEPKIVSTCNTTCEKVWPPFVIGPEESAPKKSDDALLSKINVFKRPDGKIQYAIGSTLLYYSASDKKPGDITTASGGWVVARP